MKKDSHLAIILATLVLTMLGVAYASVPLYRLFCQKTGYGGTPQIGGNISNVVLNREITVQFTANTHRTLPWLFKPLQHSIREGLSPVFTKKWYSDYKSASSVERIEAFIKLDISDPVEYADENGPVSWEVAKSHVE